VWRRRGRLSDFTSAHEQLRSCLLRRLVVERAGERCEYCRYPQSVSFLTFEVEHSIAEKHGGATEPENLALACPFCNDHKGTDLASLDPENGVLTPLFNPRTQNWSSHFRLEGAQIVPLTAEGRFTVKLLQMNHPDRVSERELLLRSGTAL
jgi:hypothetical protein